MGSRFGAAEIKSHRWFSDIQWPLLRHQTPPLKPYVDALMQKNGEAGQGIAYDQLDASLRGSTADTLDGKTSSSSAADEFDDPFAMFESSA
jgi:hypothetical protein